MKPQLQNFEFTCNVWNKSDLLRTVVPNLFSVMDPLDHRFSKWGPRTSRGWNNSCLGFRQVTKKVQKIKSDEQFENMSAVKQW